MSNTTSSLYYGPAPTADPSESRYTTTLIQTQGINQISLNSGLVLHVKPITALELPTIIHTNNTHTYISVLTTTYVNYYLDLLLLLQKPMALTQAVTVPDFKSRINLNQIYYLLDHLKKS